MHERKTTASAGIGVTAGHGTGHLSFSFSVRKLPLGCFGTSLLAMTIQLDRRPLVAAANGGGIKAPSKPFSKLLQNSRVLLQAFPNKSLAVLWDFNGLQVFQTPFDAFQIFRLRPPAFGRILPGFTMQFRTALSSRSSDPDRENFEPNSQSGFWEEISIILPSRHWQVPDRPPAVPLDETGLPLLRTLRPLSEFITSLFLHEIRLVKSI